MPFDCKHDVNKAGSELRFGQDRISAQLRRQMKDLKQASQGAVMNDLNIATARHR